MASIDFETEDIRVNHLELLSENYAMPLKSRRITSSYSSVDGVLQCRSSLWAWMQQCRFNQGGREGATGCRELSHRFRMR